MAGGAGRGGSAGSHGGEAGTRGSGRRAGCAAVVGLAVGARHDGPGDVPSARVAAGAWRAACPATARRGRDGAGRRRRAGRVLPAVCGQRRPGRGAGNGANRPAGFVRVRRTPLTEMARSLAGPSAQDDGERPARTPGQGPGHATLKLRQGGRTPWRRRLGPGGNDRPGHSPVEEVHGRPGSACQDRATRPRLAASPGRLREQGEAVISGASGGAGLGAWRGPAGDPRAGSGRAYQRSAGREGGGRCSGRTTT